MELKLDSRYMGKERALLLIVPYGIETLLPPPPPPCISLLIVPYGIETEEKAGGTPDNGGF